MVSVKWIGEMKSVFAGCYSVVQYTELDRGRGPLMNKQMPVVAVLVTLLLLLLLLLSPPLLCASHDPSPRFWCANLPAEGEEQVVRGVRQVSAIYRYIVAGFVFAFLFLQELAVFESAADRFVENYSMVVGETGQSQHHFVDTTAATPTQPESQPQLRPVTGLPGTESAFWALKLAKRVLISAVWPL